MTLNPDYEYAGLEDADAAFRINTFWKCGTEGADGDERRVSLPRTCRVGRNKACCGRDRLEPCR